MATRGPGSREVRLHSPADACSFGARADPALSHEEQLRLHQLDFAYGLPQEVVAACDAYPAGAAGAVLGGGGRGGGEVPDVLRDRDVLTLTHVVVAISDWVLSYQVGGGRGTAGGKASHVSV